MLIAKLRPRLQTIQAYCRDIDDAIEDMQEEENQWRHRIKELKYQCTVLEARIASMRSIVEKDLTKPQPFAQKSKPISKAIKLCPHCGEALERRVAFYQYNPRYVCIDSFMYCVRCQLYFHLMTDEEMGGKCKMRHCNQPAFHKGLCFDHLKHDNYEVR